MSKNSEVTEQLIDKRAAAELTGLSVAHINRLVCQRSIPHYKLGSSPKSPVRFRASELMKWMKGFQVAVA